MYESAGVATVLRMIMLCRSAASFICPFATSERNFRRLKPKVALEPDTKDLGESE